jgi:hypothetical protein
MALKYCQSHKCHTYDTKDRKRGSKGNKTNQTRRAIDSVSGRIVEPKILTEENAWRRVWNRLYWDDNTLPRYIERNMISGAERPIQEN